MQTVEGVDPDLVRTIVEDVNVVVDVSADLLGPDLTETVDTLDGALQVEGSRVGYDGDVDVHRTCTLVLSEQLDWPRARVRPRMRLTSDAGSFEVTLGTFRLGTPTRQAGRDWTVTGYDLTSLLRTEHGETYEVPEGAAYVTAAETLAASRGATMQVSAAGETRMLPRPRWWSLDIPTLQSLAELLEEGGFTAPYADPWGTLRSGLLIPAADRGVEWTYDADHPRTTVGEDGEYDDGTGEIPNRIVGVTDSPLSWAAVEGDGQHTIVDQPSIDRTGETRTVVVRIEASDQTVLVQRTAEEFARRRRPVGEVRMSVAVNPLHFHEDIVQAKNSELDVDLKALVTRFSLPFDGSDMTLTARST